MLLPDDAGEKDLRGGVQLRLKRRIVGRELDVANGKLPGRCEYRYTRQTVVLQHVKQCLKERLRSAPAASGIQRQSQCLQSFRHCPIRGREFWHSCAGDLWEPHHQSVNIFLRLVPSNRMRTERSKDIPEPVDNEHDGERPDKELERSLESKGSSDQ